MYKWDFRVPLQAEFQIANFVGSLQHRGMPPLLCDRYDVEEQYFLGQGRHGPVIRALDTRTDHLVAIKVFDGRRLDAKAGGQMLDAFMLEVYTRLRVGGAMPDHACTHAQNAARTTGELERLLALPVCPESSVSLLNYSRDASGAPGFADDGCCYAVLELGLFSLAQLVIDAQHEPLSVGEVRETCADLFCLLGSIHRAGGSLATHSPAELMRCKSGWKVIRAGSFRRVSIAVVTQALVASRGEPWYHAPEKAAALSQDEVGEFRPTAPMDVWAVSLMMLELVLPAPLLRVRAEADAAGFRHWLSGADAIELPAAVDSFSPELAALMRDELLLRDPHRRVSALGVLQHPFFDAVPLPDEAAPTSVPPSVDEEKAEPRSRALQVASIIDAESAACPTGASVAAAIENAASPAATTKAAGGREGAAGGREGTAACGSSADAPLLEAEAAKFKEELAKREAEAAKVEAATAAGEAARLRAVSENEAAAPKRDAAKLREEYKRRAAVAGADVGRRSAAADEDVRHAKALLERAQSRIGQLQIELEGERREAAALRKRLETSALDGAADSGSGAAEGAHSGSGAAKGSAIQVDAVRAQEEELEAAKRTMELARAEIEKLRAEVPAHAVMLRGANELLESAHGRFDEMTKALAVARMRANVAEAELKAVRRGAVRVGS